MICSSPEGIAGDGYHVSQDVCYVTMIRDSTRRRIERKFAKTEPDLNGSLPTDGVSFAISLVEDDSEDLLDLKSPEDSLRRGLSGELGDEDADAHDRD